MRKEIEEFKQKTQSDLQNTLDIIAQNEENIIIRSNKIVGVCVCKGKGGFINIPGEFQGSDCDGKGQCKKFDYYDPCGRNEYSYHKCPLVERIPPLFVDHGEGI